MQNLGLAMFTMFYDKGGLLYPSAALYGLIRSLEEAFTHCFSMNRLHSESILDVMALLKNRKEKVVGCESHSRPLTNKVIDLYVITRLHFLLSC